MVIAEEMYWEDSFKGIMVEERVWVRHDSQKILKV